VGRPSAPVVSGESDELAVSPESAWLAEPLGFCGPAGESDPVELVPSPSADDEVESAGSAAARHGVASNPTPIPSATASAPTRPIVCVFDAAVLALTA